VEGDAVIAANCDADAKRDQLFGLGVKRFESAVCAIPENAFIRLVRRPANCAIARSRPLSSLVNHHTWKSPTSHLHANMSVHCTIGFDLHQPMRRLLTAQVSSTMLDRWSNEAIAVPATSLRFRREL